MLVSFLRLVFHQTFVSDRLLVALFWTSSWNETSLPQLHSPEVFSLVMSSTSSKPLRTGACGPCFLNRRLMAVCGTIVLLTIVGCILASSILDKQKTPPTDNPQSSLELMKRQNPSERAAGGFPTEVCASISFHGLQLTVTEGNCFHLQA